MAEPAPTPTLSQLMSEHMKFESAHRATPTFRTNCPLCKEKCKSLFVNDRTGRFYCFGCHIKGDITNWREVLKIEAAKCLI